MSQLVPLTENEIASMGGKYTHYFIIDATRGDCTMDTATTAQVFTVFTPQKGDVIKDVASIATEFFEDTTDANSITTAIAVGDTNDDDVFIIDQEINNNVLAANRVQWAYNSGDGLPYALLTSSTVYGIIVTMRAPTSGKKISHYNKGRVVILFNIFRPPLGITARSTGGSIAGATGLGTLG